MFGKAADQISLVLESAKRFLKEDTEEEDITLVPELLPERSRKE